MRIATRWLKVGAAGGLTAAEIGVALCRDVLTEPSRVERLVARAEVSVAAASRGVPLLPPHGLEYAAADAAALMQLQQQHQQQQHVLGGGSLSAAYAAYAAVAGDSQRRELADAYQAFERELHELMCEEVRTILHERRNGSGMRPLRWSPGDASASAAAGALVAPPRDFSLPTTSPIAAAAAASAASLSQSTAAAAAAAALEAATAATASAGGARASPPLPVSSGSGGGTGSGTGGGGLIEGTAAEPLSLSAEFDAEVAAALGGSTTASAPTKAAATQSTVVTPPPPSSPSPQAHLNASPVSGGLFDFDD